MSGYWFGHNYLLLSNYLHMHWNCVTVLFSGIRRNGENLLLLEGNTMVSTDKTPLLGLWAGWIFYWLSSHPEKQGRWLLDVCFYILFFTVHSCVLYSFTHLNLKPFPRFECIKLCVCVLTHFFDKFYIVRHFYYLVIIMA